jgi:hypothetical protein
VVEFNDYYNSKNLFAVGWIAGCTNRFWEGWRQVGYDTETENQELLGILVI